MTPNEIALSIVGALGVIGGGLAVRRRASSDNTEIAKDKNERAQLARDMAELQQLRAVVGGYVEKVARLESEKKYLKRDMVRLIALLEKRKMFLPAEVREAVETNFGSFDSGGQDK